MHELLNTIKFILSCNSMTDGVGKNCFKELLCAFKEQLKVKDFPTQTQNFLIQNVSAGAERPIWSPKLFFTIVP